jgi:hypothetical protein
VATVVQAQDRLAEIQHLALISRSMAEAEAAVPELARAVVAAARLAQA